jgi:hypothetical protein
VSQTGSRCNCDIPRLIRYESGGSPLESLSERVHKILAINSHLLHVSAATEQKDIQGLLIWTPLIAFLQLQAITVNHWEQCDWVKQWHPRCRTCPHRTNWLG